MGRNSGGYTIIEVMIVIAITGVLFLSAVLVFQQQQSRTEFSQAMQDISSKIQNFASEVSSGNYDGSQGYYCTVNASNGQVSLTKTSSDDSGCVFLGRVIQVDQGQGDMKSYAILGSRDSFSGGRDSNQLATTINQANPTLATYNGAAISEEDYQLPSGATFLSSKASASGSEWETAAIYNNLQASGASSNNGNNILLRVYNCNISGGCSGITSINTCLSSAASGGCGFVDTPQWLLCVQGGNGRKAQLEVDDENSGINTKLTYDSCS